MIPPPTSPPSSIITNTGITTEQENIVFDTIKQFSNWVVAKGIVKDLKIEYKVDLPFANEDWVMRVDVGKGEVSFNTQLSENCSFEYFKSIVIHEFFHLAVQRLPNKEDATKVKDDFGDQLMKLIDIEADFFTALFYKEVLEYNIVEYLQLYYEGRSMFKDKWIRPVKFERFIGTLISICKMYLQGDTDDSYDLYLPTITPVYTDESLHVLVVRKEHIYMDSISVNYQDFVHIKECYTDIDGFTAKKYIREIITFACKALKRPVPKEITNLIEQL